MNEQIGNFIFEFARGGFVGLLLSTSLLTAFYALGRERQFEHVKHYTAENIAISNRNQEYTDLVLGCTPYVVAAAVLVGGITNVALP